jgi:SAM-dependent methyltransferase
MNIPQDLQQNVLPPFQRLLQAYGNNIKIHPYYTGPFEIFEESQSSDVTWDLDPLFKIVHQYSHHDGQLLEIGCGSGRITFSLAEKGFNILGVDNSQDSLARFSKRLKFRPDLAPRLGTLHADFLSETCIFDSKFDQVVLGNVSINSFREKDAAIALLKRVKNLLKPGGVFCFGIFADDSVPNMANYKGQTLITPYKDDRGIQRIMWGAMNFELESQLRVQTYFLEALPEEKNGVLGHLSVIRERIWSLSTLTPLLQATEFSIIDKVECAIEGGGGHGWPILMIAAQPNIN